MAHQIPVIGVVGGIGSGKSTVCRWVAEHANVLMIDADDLGHQVLQSDPVKSALRDRFGNDIFDDCGMISRRKLGHRVFGESEAKHVARMDLERVVHPAIEQRIVQMIAAAEQSGCQAVLLDAAVMLEAGWQRRCDAVVFVDAPDDVRWKRVQARNGWSLDEFRRRESSQMNLDEKKRRCDAVISNFTDASEAGNELLDFLCDRWTNCCKLPPKSSQQSVTSE